MSAQDSSGPPPAMRVPTLTEIVELAEPQADVPIAEWPPAAEVPAQTGLVPDNERASDVAPPAADEASLRERLIVEVMAQLQQRIDLMFEVRLREALAPVLARVAEQLVHEAGDTLAGSLRDMVARAVANELARRNAPLR